MKPGSLKFCLLLSLLCHVAGFAAWQFFAAPPLSTESLSRALPTVVTVLLDAPVEKFSVPPPSATARPSLDKKISRLFAAENFVPLKPLTAPPAGKAAKTEDHFAGLARGETDAANHTPLAETTSNSVIVGARISRVFAVANIQPEYLRNPQPEYPATARRRHQEGIVWLRVHVTARGTPDRVEVLHTSGFDPLDDAALRAVRAWQFTPAQLGEMAVESEIDFPIQFRLE